MRNGIEVRHATFNADAQRLIDGLGLFGKAGSSKPKAPSVSNTRTSAAVNNPASAAAPQAAPAWIFPAVVFVLLLLLAAFALADPFEWRGPHYG